jgi:hypothetical protein
MVSISPTNVCNVQRRQHKVNAQKMQIGFTTISAQILKQVLGNCFCTERHILAHFCQMLLPFKA